MMRIPMTLAALSALFATSGAGAAQPSYPFADAVRVGDLLYLSGQIGIAPGSSTPVAGGIAAETRQTMDNIGAILRKRQLGYHDLVKCTVMLSDMAQWPELNRAYSSYFPDGQYPARSAFGATALALGAHVEIDCIARFPEAQAINASTPLGPYSQAIRSGDTVYISGIVAFDPKAGRFAAPDIQSQMRQLFANLDALLAAGGLNRSSIVKTTLFLQNPTDLAAANAAYAGYFSHSPRPARTTVAGADWGRRDLIVEMEAVVRAADTPKGAGQ